MRKIILIKVVSYLDQSILAQILKIGIENKVQNCLNNPEIVGNTHFTNVVSQHVNDLTKRMVSVETNIPTLNTDN